MKAIRRIALILTAYVASVPSFFLALTVLFGLAAAVYPAPGYWTAFGVSPALLAGAPIAGLFLVFAGVILSAVPTLVVVILAEWFAWRSPWAYAVPAAAMAATVYWTLSPRTIDGLDGTGAAEMVLFAAAGACAGLVYWGLAGRRAGGRR